MRPIGSSPQADGADEVLWTSSAMMRGELIARAGAGGAGLGKEDPGGGALQGPGAPATVAQASSPGMRMRAASCRVPAAAGAAPPESQGL